MIIRHSIGFVLLLLMTLSSDGIPESRKGVIVEAVKDNFEAEKAGLRPGDVILHWVRADAQGDIDSPFDLFQLETEQKPRGPIVLGGLRGDEKKTWTPGPGNWGLTVRPQLTDGLLSVYRSCQALTQAGNTPQTSEPCRADPAISGPVWLRSWFALQAAEALVDSRQWNDADNAYAQALQIAGGDEPATAAAILNRWAIACETRGDLENAARHYQDSLLRYEKLSAESLAVATNLNGLGSVGRKRGDLKNAEEYSRRALAIEEKLAPDSLGVATSFSNLGLVAWNRGDLPKAEEYQKLALQIRQKLAPDSLDLASSFNALGLVAWNRGELDTADEYHHLALQIRQKLAPDGLDVAGSFNNLGAVAKDRGDLVKAEEYYLDTLQIRKKLAPGSLLLATSFNNLGTVAASRGDLAKAEEYYQKALEIQEKLAPGSLDCYSSLLNLGVVAVNRNDLAKAEKYYRQALLIVEKLAPGSLDVADSLNNLGVVSWKQEDLTKAEEYYRQSLEIREKLAPGGLEVATSFSNLGNLAWKRKDFAKAEEYYGQALTIHQKLAPESVNTAEIYKNLAEVARDRNKLTEAEKYYRQALSIRSKMAPTSSGYAEVLASLAGILRRQGQPNSAAELYEQALTVFESQNSQLGGAEETRSTFRAAHSNYFLDYIDLLMFEKKPDLAFHVAERWRARSLLEMLAAAEVDIRQGVDPELRNRERWLQELLKAKSDRRITLLTAEHTEKQIAEVEKEISDLRNQYDDLQGRIRANSPSYASLTHPQPLNATQTQSLLDDETILLDYVLGEEHSFVWAITRDSLDGFELPPRSRIEDLARRLHHLISMPQSASMATGEIEAGRRSRLETTASALSQMVLAPLAARITKKRLLIVSDGALQYVPFAVLPVPGHSKGVPLVVEHEVVYAPSASVLAELRRQAMGRTQAPKAVAVLADPVFDKNDPRVGRPTRKAAAIASNQLRSSPDERLARSVADVGLVHLSRLVFSRREAEAIMAATPPGQGKKALDFEANRATATGQELYQYRIVHFATHALSDNKRPELSGLILSLVDQHGQSQNGFLDLEDIYNLHLRADMVVLSACETALGKEIRGEGLIGLTRGFMYAGATRVLASLWKVDDVATAELMARFYKAMEQQGLRPAAALRRAQLAMRRQKRWVAPYYWAGFQLQGEWK